MKKIVTVTIEKQFEIEIQDDRLTPEEIAGFEKTMWPVAGPEDLFTYAGGQIARYENCFVEGIGPAKEAINRKDEPISYREIYDDTSVEVADVPAEASA